MRRFEDYWVEETRWEEAQARHHRERAYRRRTREEQLRRKKSRLCFIAAVVLWAVLVIWLLANGVRSSAVELEPAAKAVTVQALQDARPDDGTELGEPDENRKIEDALVESGYFRDDIPLDYDTQAFLRSACEESGVEYELALAVIRKETEYRNIAGDGGDSVGYMQVQEKWHGERMERLGVTDLSDPYSNFRVGCDYLAELLDKYPLEEALTAYNRGTPGKSQYAQTVLRYMEELR